MSLLLVVCFVGGFALVAACVTEIVISAALRTLS